MTSERSVDAPSDEVFADDLVVGRAYDAGELRITAEEIVEFARQWDPQPFHIDPEIAAAGQFGEVIASGIHSFAIFQRLAVLNVYSRWQIIAGRAVRDITFPKPVRPGTTLHATVTITDVDRRSDSRSLVFKHGVLTDDAGDVVFTMRAEAYMRNRPPLNVRVDSPSDHT